MLFDGGEFLTPIGRGFGFIRKFVGDEFFRVDAMFGEE